MGCPSIGFLLQMPITAGTGLWQSWELKIQSRSPLRVTGTQLFEPSADHSPGRRFWWLT